MDGADSEEAVILVGSGVEMHLGLIAEPEEGPGVATAVNVAMFCNE